MRAHADARSFVPAHAHAQHTRAHASTRCTRMQVRTHGYMDTHAYMHMQDNDLSLCDGRGYIRSHSGSVLALHFVTFLSSIAPIAVIPMWASDFQSIMSLLKLWWLQSFINLLVNGQHALADDDFHWVTKYDRLCIQYMTKYVSKPDVSGNWPLVRWNFRYDSTLQRHYPSLHDLTLQWR